MIRSEGPGTLTTGGEAAGGGPILVVSGHSSPRVACPMVAVKQAGLAAAIRTVKGLPDQFVTDIENGGVSRLRPAN